MTRRKERRKAPPGWTPFRRAEVGPEELARVARATGLDLSRFDTGEVYVNDRYQVAVRRYPGYHGAAALVHLSVKRLDKAPVHSWRDLQRVKNELLGTEVEAVELYPAESRRVDAANQYHLWAIEDPAYRWPFGFSGRTGREGARPLPGPGRSPEE